MLNTLPALPAARQPRAIVKLGGSAIPGWVSWEVTSNTYYEADTFRVSFAVSSLPKERNVAWFFSQKSITVEILAGFPTNPADPNAAELIAQNGSLIYGNVDEIDFDPVSTLITVHGRDLTAAFIDAKMDFDFVNKTASEVAAYLAIQQFLTPVITATKTKVGTYYKNNTQLLLRTQGTQWDCLTELAKDEGFSVYVKGNELHFEPAPLVTSEPYVIKWHAPSNDSAAPVANVQDLSFTRSMTVSRGVNVTVRSASLLSKTAVAESYPGRPPTPAMTGTVQQYEFTLRAGLKPDQAQQIALNRYNQIVSHEMKLRARLPGDNILTTKNVIRVQGTGTPLDQTYQPMQITRSMSIDEGYVMVVEAQNYNPATLAIHTT